MGITGHTVTIYAAHDPRWFLNYLVAAGLLAVPISVGARLAKAQRTTIFLSFALALTGVLACHFAAPAKPEAVGMLVAALAGIATLALGNRYLLVMGGLASVTLAFAVFLILGVGLLAAIAVGIA